VKAHCAVLVAIAVALCPTTALAQATTFSFTGTEQTYTVPAGYSYLHVRAVGGAGGGPTEFAGGLLAPPYPEFPNGGRLAGRGAVVAGNIAVAPGQVLYVLVGNSGGLPHGGFNGGGQGGSRSGWMLWGGGGASDVRTLPSSQGTVSLESRLIVAAGGGGSAWIAAAGGDAGRAGNCCGAFGNGPIAAQPGTQTAGGSGGACEGAAEGCGEPGDFGTGGDGGASRTPGDYIAAGGGGGAGWYGGGGGGGHVSNTSGGAGGSSRRPGGGTFALADFSTPPAVEITPTVAPPSACSDGADNDVDGLVDHPSDPGCGSSRDRDEWNPDTLAPDARLSGPRAQRLGRSVNVELSCLATTEDCIVSATATLTVGRAARAYRLNRVRSVVVPRGTKLVLRLGVPSATRNAAARALRTRSRTYANVDVRASDEIGNVHQLIRRIRLVRGSP
jgi:Glycine rich protein